MSILTGKDILVVGDETSQIHNIESVVEAEGMKVHPTTCDLVSVDKIEHDHIDVVLLNHLHEGSACIEMLSSLRERRVHKVLPIIALVENNPTKIDEALALGAADYITSDEPLDSIIQKMKSILGEPDTFANTDLFDLNTEPKTEIDQTGRVFVVEDDALLRNLITLRLEKTGFTFEVHAGESEVLPAVLKFKPDVLILDLMLPGQDGFDILKSLREHDDEALKTLPVIVFSNKDSQEDRQRAMGYGISGYYVKAMTDLAELMQSVSDVLKEKTN